MRKFFIVLFTLLPLSMSLMASPFQWGFQQIWLKGEKQEVLVL
jgi:hypothetical protein